MKVVRVLGLTTRKVFAQPREALLSARMAMWVVLVSLLARTMSLPRAQQIASLNVQPASPSAADAAATQARLARTIDSLLGLEFLVFRRSCWKRAMVLHRFLALHGIESRINFGLQKKADGAVLGHAWLEHRGQPLLEDDAGSYVVTFSLPRKPAAWESWRKGLSPLHPHGDREMRLLLLCARASVAPEAAEHIRALAAGDLDWNRLLTLAERNGLRPLLYTHLNRICPSSVPAAEFDFLRDYFAKNSAFSLLFTGQLLRLLAVLNDHGIEAMPFKGPAIAVKLYGHVALRQFCDLDILVRARDVWRASELIEARGFKPDFHIPPERRAAFIRQDYVQMFRGDAGRTLVELHWGFARQSFGVAFDADAVWPRRERMTLLGQSVLMPCAEDLLLMLCVHGSKHAWDKLEGLSSLAELIRGRKDFDWDHVWQKAGEMRSRRMLVFSLLLVRDLFGVPLPPQAEALGRSRVLQKMAGAVVRSFLTDDRHSQTYARQAALHLRLKDRYTDQARYCARVVLTPTPEDWAAVRLRGPLSLAYPLVRAFRIARHSFNQQKAAGGCP